MLTCVPRSKQANNDHDESKRNDDGTTNKKPIKRIGSQVKEMARKASGAYRSCAPCTPATTITPQQRLQKSNNDTESESPMSVSEKFRWSYRRSGSKNSSSGRVWGKEMEARLKGISVGSDVAVTEMLSASASGRKYDPIVLMEEVEPKEWVAQVEPGVLITFISLPTGGNDLKQIRFSREMFNKWQAQRWWQDNYEKVMELYNVKRLSRQAFPLPTATKSEDEPTLESKNSKTDPVEDSPLTPTLSKERVPHTLHDHQSSTVTPSTSEGDSSGLTVTSKGSSISGTKTETSSMDASTSATSPKEADRTEEASISNVSDADNEWVEEDEPGVYITIRVLPDGSRELRRVRFSRETFGEVHARIWWEENRARIHKQYL
ncbi:BREVIS RADIX-like 4 [Artemisia annua]|uniref:BREVIS RADIX-like 4 n=1 Tax=Artemisia annua TaxID=35608 RepID=A0A2U1N9M4_ARTAN|nr:BREVIS RADIX-like 4 [Artemisia annua]